MHRSFSPLFGLFLLTGPAVSYAQSAAADTSTQITSAAPRRTLLKLGLNAARAVRWSGYYGPSVRLPVTAGIEHALSSKITLYGQLDADFRLARRSEYYGSQDFLLPSAALSVGARYYYNQAGRARRHRPTGPFIGNYLALELHNELRRHAAAANDYRPSLNVVWGMQRRLGHCFLFDFNAGLGVGPALSPLYIGYDSNIALNAQFNLSFYLAR